MAEETGGFDPVDLIFLCVRGYFLRQLALALRTSGGWRKASLVPAAVMVPMVALTGTGSPPSRSCGRLP